MKNEKFNEILHNALQAQKEIERREKLYKENDMSKFVQFGNVIVNTDQIICIMDNGGKREIMLHNLSLVTDETFGELLEILNDKESSVQWIMNAGKGERNE